MSTTILPRSFIVPAIAIAIALGSSTLPLPAQEISYARLPDNPVSDPFVAHATPFSDSFVFGFPFVPMAPPTPGSGPAIGIQPLRPVQTTIQVNAGQETFHGSFGATYRATQGDILSSAGTWKDATRYLQTMPGVVWNTDVSNDVIVRGGHPSENLYVVDGIEIPNINHLALEGTTGGFTSMIDTASISSVDLKAGIYDARYSSRLSSLIDIHTLEGRARTRAGELDLGIAGAGGFVEHPIGRSGSLLLSGHRSVLNLVTDDIGLNGVPIYTNGLARLELSPSDKDYISALSLDGGDSIAIRPNACDQGVTLPDRTQYDGIRGTHGIIWQHTHGPAVVSTLTGSYSGQNQDVGQLEQATTYANYTQCMNHPIQTTAVYKEQTYDGIPTLGYGIQFGSKDWFFSIGTIGRLARMNYAVAQPIGQQSPFNTNPTWTDATSFNRNFASGQTGTYLEATGHIDARWTVIAGVREETFALTNSHMLEPRASFAFRISERQAAHASYGRSAQLAPSINILSYAQNERLRPIQVSQFAVGADLWRMDRATITIEAFHKTYTNEPVSTEYPSLMLANMVDTLGQQFVWLPLKSGGRGRSEGVELLVRAQWARKLQFLGAATYGRTLYAAADGVMRPGNFDLPLVINGLATARLPWKIQASFRNTYATGRPYTPFNISLSEKQSRGVYDLTRVNALRGSAYNRLDFDVNRAFRIHKGLMNIHAGVQNALDRQNFLGYVWMDNCRAPWKTTCGLTPTSEYGVPETKATQMPLFPDAGVRYSF